MFYYRKITSGSKGVSRIWGDYLADDLLFQKAIHTNTIQQICLGQLVCVRYVLATNLRRELRPKGAQVHRLFLETIFSVSNSWPYLGWMEVPKCLWPIKVNDEQIKSWLNKILKMKPRLPKEPFINYCPSNKQHQDTKVLAKYFTLSVFDDLRLFAMWQHCLSG